MNETELLKSLRDSAARIEKLDMDKEQLLLWIKGMEITLSFVLLRREPKTLQEMIDEL